MIGKRLNKKQRQEKDKENLKNILNDYLESKRLVQSLRRKKTATIYFEGTYDKLLELCKMNKPIMKEIDTELSAATARAHGLHYKYKLLKHKVDLQKKVENAKNEIKEMKKEEYSIAKCNKQLSMNFDLNKLNNLPLEVVDIIKTFIPYEIRNTLIEERKPFRLFKNITPRNLKSFLMNICYTPEYFSLLSDDEKKSYIYKPENNPHSYLPNLYTPHYGHFDWNPDWLQYNNRHDIETRIKHIFHLLKRGCPKGAYKLMRMFIVLINPDKKYDNYDGNWLRITSIPV